MIKAKKELCLVLAFDFDLSSFIPAPARASKNY
jgi:hypothetical protein